MSVQRPHDSSYDLTVQPTVSALHIPVSHAFIPFQQFSITDASVHRNPADDNNNKTSLPVVSVVTAVSGLCPTIPVVSMQQTAHLAQAVVAPTIISGVVTPMTVHAGNCLTPTTTMTVSKALNISSHISMPIQQQQQQNIGIPVMASQSNGVTINPHSHTNSHQSTIPTTPGNKPSGSSSSPPSNNNSIAQSSKSSSKTTASNTNSEQNEDLVKPVFKDGELVLEVECGQNKAILYLSKLCQGSKGPCISFQSSWLTPNEFQFVSGRETAKDWKRSIRHHGKSLKLLLAKGILNVHPTMCDCDGCRQGATLTRKGEKRRIPNGERKPRKPTSGSNSAGSDGSSTGSFRPVGSTTMAAHSASPGAPTTKPEVKRSAVDKPKMEDTASALTDLSGKLFNKSPPTQRPSTLTPPRESHKQAPPISTPPTPSIGPTSLTHHISPAVPFTPSKPQPFPTASTSSPDTAAAAQFPPISPHGLLAPPAGTSSILAAPQEQQPGRPHSDPSFPPPPAQNVNVSATAHIPTDTHPLQSPSGYSEGHSNHEMSDDEDDDNQFDDDTDGSQNAYDDDIDESDDDVSQNSSKDSEINDSISDDDHAVGDASGRSVAIETTNTLQSPPPQNEINSAHTGVQESTEKEPTDFNRTTEPNNIADISASATSSEDKHNNPVSEPVAPSTAPVAALAVSVFPGTCSQPLSLPVPCTNVKSEHIWVPPRMSPQGDPSYTHRAHNSSSRGRSPTDTAHTPLDNSATDPPKIFSQIKENDLNNLSRKPERPPQVKDHEHTSLKSDIIPGAANSKDFHSIERHLSRTHDGERVKCEQSQVKPGQAPNSASSEKNVREQEREERHRQRVREERNRREREERNRKDREREERREFERREEKDTEKRRQEEKERREMAKAQSESNAAMDASAAASLMDPSRRPTGGVAEAAAFSDYMRMLAAGHGHTFISPALNYMPHILPFRAQEAAIPTLLHPMSAFGHQLNGIAKDPMLYQTAGAVLSNYGTAPFGPVHPLLQRQQYTTQQTLLDYQRSLTAASSYPWPTAYPYFLHDISAASSSSTSATASMAAGAKRPSSEIEAAMEMSAKRMRMENRPAEYSSPWDYFAAAAQHQRGPAMAPSLPCGLESASMDKTAEYLRKRYMEYGPQAAAYLSAFPEYVRSPYHCACADHRDDNIHMWSVDDVCKFLHTVEGCAVYSDHFREQRVTGRILSLLTSDHLVKTMGMKLGPAVQLAEAVARKLQDSSKISSCEACRNIAVSQSFHPMALPL